MTTPKTSTAPIRNAVDAATHADPYAWYAELRRNAPLFFDPSLKLWIASRAAAVSAVFAHADCHVRPAHEPVPLGEVDPQQLGQRVAALARDEAPFRAPTPQWADALNEAATALLLRFEDLLTNSAMSRHATVGTNLVSRVQAHATQTGWADRQAVLCNLIGLLSQTFEATAGLIGNAVVALATRPGLLAELPAHPQAGSDMARLLVEEVCRLDAPIQNTRRFVARDMELAGRTLRAGDTVLLLLGSANRDATLNVRADEFLLQRAQRQYFSFGRGSHACPSRQIALTMAASALASWLQTAPSSLSLRAHLQALSWIYRPSVNARIPCFALASPT